MSIPLVDVLRLEAAAIAALEAPQSETIAEQTARHEADNTVIARLTAELAELTTTVAADDVWLDAELRLIQSHWSWRV